MSIHFLHTMIRVSTLDGAIAFYTTAFGYAVRARRPGPPGLEIAFLALPGDASELQLAWSTEHLPVTVPQRLMHLAFRTDDLAAVVASAVAAGASLQTGPYTLPSGSIVAFLRDPDGYDIELVQKGA